MDISHLVAKLDAMPRDDAPDPEADFVAGCLLLQEHQMYRFWKVQKDMLVQEEKVLNIRRAEALAVIESQTRRKLEINECKHQLLAAYQSVSTRRVTVRYWLDALKSDAVFLQCLELANGARDGPARLQALIKNE